MGFLESQCTRPEVGAHIRSHLERLIALPFRDYGCHRILSRINIQDELQCFDDLGLDSYIRRLGHDVRNPERQILAGRIAYEVLTLCCPQNVQELIKVVGPRFRPEITAFYRANSQRIDVLLKHYTPFLMQFHDWFSLGSLIESYLMRDRFEGVIIETPVQMHMRVAVEVYRDDGMESVEAMFKDLCGHYYSLASPAIFNAGHRRPNLSSCFLMKVNDDLDSISKRASDVAMISRDKGGNGLDISDIRSSSIGFDGQSSGINKLCRVFDSWIDYVNQTGLRPGAATICMQPNNFRIRELIVMVKKTGDHNLRTVRLNTAIFTSTLFWDRVREEGKWTIFCPKLTPGLNDAIGDRYDELYLQYEADDSIEVRETLDARGIVELAIEVQMQAGMPYILHKDAVNMKSNQVNMRLINMTPEERAQEGVSEDDPHLRTIRTSNLCLEIFEQTPDDEIACCNLGQMSLPAFVMYIGQSATTFDFQTFGEKVRAMVRNLDRVIDVTYYPREEARTSNMRHRPIGLGVSGYADMLNMLDIPYDSAEAAKLNKRIFACMYFNAVAASVGLASIHGAYPTFKHSPASEGKFQFDLWAEEYRWLKKRGSLRDEVRKETDDEPLDPLSWTGWEIPSFRIGDVIFNWSWDDLRAKMVKYGLRNSQLLALMPSASTSRIMRNAESVEKLQTVIGTRTFAKTTFPVVDRHLYYELQDLGLWTDDVVDLIQANNGSVSLLSAFVSEHMTQDPTDEALLTMVRKIQDKYKTAFETSMKTAFKHHADRSRYVCQSSSTNCYMAEPTKAKLLAFHLYVRALGNKTGMYYLRQTPTSSAPKTTVDQSILDWVEAKNRLTSSPKSKQKIVCNETVCVACQG